ncbi:hypothetical protein GCM10007968_13980 [Sporolactobacillus putidus]|uniref:Uncharacterized protein n=1 Tax=Sporolactobacillus putidus TaxID=492735 RepID=A0A917VZV1_9BACL|nr:hypothetical protein GCM10007968_13980 [Sporolactobacillus putidus]
MTPYAYKVKFSLSNTVIHTFMDYITYFSYKMEAISVLLYGGNRDARGVSVTALFFHNETVPLFER